MKLQLNVSSLLLCVSPQVQTLASQVGVMYNLFATILSLVVAPLWGPWTDKGGKRKPALLVAIVGGCLEMTTVLLVMYFNLSVYFLYVSAAISGFSGFAVVFLCGAIAYIADISTKEERAFRMGENIMIGLRYLTIIPRARVGYINNSLHLARTYALGKLFATRNR